MSVRSRALVLASVPSVSGTWVPLWTVPAGRTAIIREITAQHFGASNQEIRVQTFRDGQEGPLAQWLNVANAQVCVASPRYAVAEPGDILRIFLSGPSGQPIRTLWSGSLLLGAPS